MSHIPVLRQEIISLLNIKRGDSVIDGTMNGGGHAREFIRIIGSGTFVGIEWDKKIFDETENQIKKEFPSKVISNCNFVWGNYRDTLKILREYKIEKVDAILLDLGFSSMQIDDPSRGFSFQKDGPLDMRYNTEDGISASDVLNSTNQDELARIFYEYGEERRSRQIARAIIEYRKKKKITTTSQLVEIVESVIYKKPWMKISPATKVFQALRIYVNDELGNLEEFLKTLPEALKKGGRCGIISFHSLEDRIVKRSFRDFKNRGIFREITKKPVIPTEEEIKTNPRSRSAKLRVIEML